MAATQSDQDELVAGINVTPLVDITFVLLIIFMVTAKLITQQGIPLDLPKAASAGAIQTIFTVSVDPAGQTFVDGKPITTDDELRQAARRAIGANPELRTVVQAAGAASHRSVLHVVDELRQSGIVKIAFAAELTEAR